MKTVTIYGTPVCPYCKKARELLNQLKIPFNDIDVGGRPDYKNKLKEKYDWPTIPMILVGGEFVGGFDDLNILHERGELITKVS